MHIKNYDLFNTLGPIPTSSLSHLVSTYVRERQQEVEIMRGNEFLTHITSPTLHAHPFITIAI
uniref:Uncharacterized protein n=1 Tax=Arundo donax TaxID=35708 RepID=A0A0A9EJM5_ARUDO